MSTIMMERGSTVGGAPFSGPSAGTVPANVCILPRCQLTFEKCTSGDKACCAMLQACCDAGCTCCEAAAQRPDGPAPNWPAGGNSCGIDPGTAVPPGFAIVVLNHRTPAELAWILSQRQLYQWAYDEARRQADARRLIDFASGLTYALDGSMQRVADKVFLLTPRNVQVSAEERARALDPAGGFFNQA